MPGICILEAGFAAGFLPYAAAMGSDPPFFFPSLTPNLFPPRRNYDFIGPKYPGSP